MQLEKSKLSFHPVPLGLMMRKFFQMKMLQKHSNSRSKKLSKFVKMHYHILSNPFFEIISFDLSNTYCCTCVTRLKSEVYRSMAMSSAKFLLRPENDIFFETMNRCNK